MTDPLVGLVAKRFIQRRDLFAVQTSDGGYMPLRESKEGPYVPLKGRHISQHLGAEKTYGHYLLDSENNCRLFAFDIDLEKNGPEFTGHWVETPDIATFTGTDEEWWAGHKVHEFDAREAWRDRRHPSRQFLKTQMRFLAGMLARSIWDTLEIPVAVSYTGAKGLHVYGFVDPMPAVHVREAAQIALDSLGCFHASKGKNFYKHDNQDPIDGYPNFAIEVFPKQTSVSDGGGFGNLMRLPLGRNLKAPKDPTFFVDMTAPMSELRPHPDPVALLTSGNPWL